MGVQQAAPQLDRLGNMADLHLVAVGQIGHRARHAQGPVHAARTPAEARSGLLQKVPRLFRQLDGLFQGLTLQGGIGLMLALQRERSEVHIVNTRVGDAVPGWPADWVAELHCRVSTAGIYPLPARPLPPLADSLVRMVKAYELLTAEAAVTGSVEAALQALVAHPLGPGADRAPAFWDDLLLTHAQYLPAFGGRNAR